MVWTCDDRSIVHRCRLNYQTEDWTKDNVAYTIGQIENDQIILQIVLFSAWDETCCDSTVTDHNGFALSMCYIRF